MNYWTIQPLEQLVNLKKNGFIVCDPKLSLANDPDFDIMQLPYDWMVSRMRVKISENPDNLIYPMWCWFNSYSSKKRKPDFRHSEYRSQRKEIVRIEFEMPEENVLLSDFMLWHHVIYQIYIGNNEKDCTDFEYYLEQNYPDKKLDEFPENIRKKIIDSWDKIFDLDFHDPYLAVKRDEKCIQGTFWKLEEKHVIKID